MSQIITLKDNIRVQAEVTDERVAFKDGKVDETIDAIKPVLLKAIRPVVETWKELNQDVALESAEIELGFGFEASGNVFLASSKGNVNFKVTLKLKPV
jgi:Trypsin-co-occurring domain 1